MSNYSDFFGVGSSGGGGGIPINSYTPFLAVTTGNPTGYDATTGLYTHPDGTFWLETGKTLTATGYPDATFSSFTWSGPSDFFLAATNVNGQGQGGTFAEDVNIGFQTSFNQDRVEVYTYPTLPITADGTVTYTTSFNPNGVTGGPNPSSISADNQGNLFIRANGAGTAAQGEWAVYNTSAPYSYTGVNFDPTGQTGVGVYSTIGVDKTNNKLYAMATTPATPWTVYEYNSTAPFAYTGTSYDVNAASTAGFTSLNSTMMFTPSYNYLANGGQFMRFNKSWGGYNATIMPTNNLQLGSTQNYEYSTDGGRIYSWSNSSSGLIFQRTVADWEVSLTVGDATARTDTDTTQPLFVRIK